MLTSIFINYLLIIQPIHAAIQELPISDTVSLLFNDSYEKTFIFFQSFNLNEIRNGFFIITTLYNGSVFLKLIENATNTTISEIFLNTSLSQEYYEFEIDFGIYTIKFLNNESLNATFFYVISTYATWVDPIPFFYFLLILTIIIIIPLLINYFYNRRTKFYKKNKIIKLTS